jgi:hypothetical protein
MSKKIYHPDLTRTEVELSTWKGGDCNVGGGTGTGSWGSDAGLQQTRVGGGDHLEASSGAGRQFAAGESGRWW